MSVVSGNTNATSILLACGLGNPGEKYALTRHNAGVWCIDKLVARYAVSLSQVGQLPVTSAKCSDGMRLALTKTYMNESGLAVAGLANYFKIEPSSLLVIHDEVDLPVGVIRFKFGGGHAGHNGIKDVISHLGSKDFWRLRIGVGHPSSLVEDTDKVADIEISDWVLKKPSANDRLAIDNAIDDVCANWSDVVAGNMDAVIKTLHTNKPMQEESQKETKDDT